MYSSAEHYILALDQGTTSSRCIIFDHQGAIVAQAFKEFTQYYPHPGWVEHDPREILSSQLGVMAEAQVTASISPSAIRAVGITNQRETTIVWNRHTGEPIYNAIVWQCRRSAAAIEELKACGLTETIRQKTGLIPDAYFSATKIKWILDNVEGARAAATRGDLLFGTVDTWLIWNLTQGTVHATDYTNASRTMLFSIHTLTWDEELLALFDIPVSLLPEVRPSSGFFGRITREGFGCAIPITGVAGDQQAALFGQCCFDAGEAKNTYGTGCFLLMNTGKTPTDARNGMLTTIAASIREEPCYAVEGSVFIAGALLQWLREELGIIDTVAQTSQMAQSVDSTEGVYIVPAFTGLGAPYWDQDARGAIYGLTRGTTKAHIIRAALEALAYQVYDVTDVMVQESGIALHALRVDGGVSANDFLMQFQSDILSVCIDRSAVIETTALGAAYLAGLAAGYWDSLDHLRSNRISSRIFTPNLEARDRAILLSGWNEAVARTRTTNQHPHRT